MTLEHIHPTLELDSRLRGNDSCACAGMTFLPRPRKQHGVTPYTAKWQAAP